jgi:hypothetical protein
VTIWSAVPGSSYTWTNSNTGLGLAASGNGNIASGYWVLNKSRTLYSELGFKYFRILG